MPACGPSATSFPSTSSPVSPLIEGSRQPSVDGSLSVARLHPGTETMLKSARVKRIIPNVDLYVRMYCLLAEARMSSFCGVSPRSPMHVVNRGYTPISETADTSRGYSSWSVTPVCPPESHRALSGRANLGTDPVSTIGPNLPHYPATLSSTHFPRTDTGPVNDLLAL